MNRNASGHYDTTATGGETVRALVPFPLLPDPPLDLSRNRQSLLESSTLPLDRLDSVSTLLPAPPLFLCAYVRREAVLSPPDRGCPVVAFRPPPLRTGRGTRHPHGRCGRDL